jgi:hypothetical protein
MKVSVPFAFQPLLSTTCPLLFTLQLYLSFHKHSEPIWIPQLPFLAHPSKDVSFSQENLTLVLHR